MGDHSQNYIYFLEKERKWRHSFILSAFVTSGVIGGNKKERTDTTFNDHSHSHVTQNSLEQSVYSLLAHVDEKSKGDRKIESVYVNRQFSEFPCSSEQRPGPQGSLFPFLACLLPPTWDPPMVGERLAKSYSVLCMRVCLLCVCVLISCFIEEAVFACTDRCSDFLCEKKGQKKKDYVNSHESVWETTIIVSGKLAWSLSKNIFWFTGKVQMQRLNPTLQKHVISLF